MLPYYIVLDFEANCSKKDAKDHEIIEFPCVLIDSHTNKTIDEFRSFVKLVKHKKLSQFIKDLTHITDEQINTGLEWSDCLKQLEAWCKKHGLNDGNTMIVTCGSWDLMTMLPRQLLITNTKLPSSIKSMFTKWNNMKISFAEHFNYTKQIGMYGMLTHLDLELTGHHHSGIDDCRNIAKICKYLMENGTDVTIYNSKLNN